MEFRALETAEQREKASCLRVNECESALAREYNSSDLQVILSLTFLKTAGFGRAGPKKGTSSRAVTDT